MKITDEMVVAADAEYWSDMWSGTGDGEGKRAMRAALEAALSAQPQTVTIKPLEWTAIDGGNAFRAPALIFGWIRIETYTLNSWQVQWSVPGICNILLPSVFNTPDEAKAAAQADYEARIRSALTTQVQETVAVTVDPLTFQLERGKLYESHHFGLVEYVGVDRYYGEVTHEFRISGASGFQPSSRYTKPEKLFDFLKPPALTTAPAQELCEDEGCPNFGIPHVCFNRVEQEPVAWTERAELGKLSDDETGAFWASKEDDKQIPLYLTPPDQSARIAELEKENAALLDENHELKTAPWPEWATAVLKVVRKHSGYDGYDDATEGVDLPTELEDHLSAVQHDAQSWQDKSKAGDARIAELEAALADADKLYEHAVHCVVGASLPYSVKDAVKNFMPLCDAYKASRAALKGKAE